MIFTDSKPTADFYTSDVFIKKDKIAVFIDKEKEFVYKVFPKSKTLKFFKELTALTLLRNNFINNQNIPHYPFPQIYNVDLSKQLIKINYCGVSAYILKRIKKPFFLYETVECIIENLKLNNIVYKDIHANNVCINHNNYLHLIDFECCYTEIDLRNLYDKPSNLKDYKNLDLYSLGSWKSKPWSILYMF